MESKDWLLMTAVVVIVAVLVSFLTVKITGNAINGSYTLSANSCDADTICEMKNARVSEIIVDGATKTNTLTVVGTSYFGNSKISDVLGVVTKNITTSYLTTTNNMIASYIGAKDLTLTSMTGSGNGYVCVNYLGKIYRSQKACI